MVPWQERQAIKVLLARWIWNVVLCEALERGRFLWPSSADGVMTITPAKLGYLLEDIG